MSNQKSKLFLLIKAKTKKANRNSLEKHNLAIN